ncbi:MAG TPA: hypothetical protein P5140_07690 [Methanofastidiosum sp.]|nr:hypothetical protein [Methanofastidiosum sp.]
MNMQNELDKKDTLPSKLLEGVPVSDEELQKKKESLAPNQRLVEVSPGSFKVLQRMQG